MTASIITVDGSPVLKLKRSDGNYAIVHLSESDLERLHSEIEAIVPSLSVPKEMSKAIKSLHTILTKHISK